MLEFFRTYQRYIFLFITVVLIASFSFFGMYDAVRSEETREDPVIGQAIDGSAIQLSEVRQLSHFLATDREDSPISRGGIPNLVNDGVIRYDFLRTELADLLVSSYFEPMKGDLAARLEKAKRYRPYVHPDAPFLSARLMWERFLPALNGELEFLVQRSEASPKVFSHLAKLYQQQASFPPELLRRILLYQHQQYPWLHIDPRLSQEDLSLFGFHSLADWFGNDFVDLISQFILNAAAAATEKGYRVSLEEAQGDLIHNFQVSMEKLAKAKIKPELSFGQHLRTLGFDDKSAAEVWRKVLLFRRLFQDVGEATFVDSLPFKDFLGYAKATAVVQKYQAPICLENVDDLLQFQLYLKAVAPPSQDPLTLPTEYLGPEQVKKEFPELVQTTYKVKAAEVTKEQIALRPSLKEVWEWQLEEKNWTQLKQKFSFLSGENRQERFQSLEALQPAQRSQVVGLARHLLVDQNPVWVEEALAAAPMKELTLSLAANDPRFSLLERAAAGDAEAIEKLHLYAKEGKFSRMEGIEKVEEAHLLTYVQAKPLLSSLLERYLESKFPKMEKEEAGRQAFSSLFQAMDRLKIGDGYAKNRLLVPMQEAYKALQKDRADSQWIKGEGSPLTEQFKLEKQEQNLHRTSQENWMKEQAFVLVPNEWSPIHVPEDGQIVFFYLAGEETGENLPFWISSALGKKPFLPMRSAIWPNGCSKRAKKNKPS